jgi:TonB-linked SusC/RagA family outer membrane protein
MTFGIRECLLSAAAVAVVSSSTSAQQAVVLTGRVTGHVGVPLSGAEISVPLLGIATTTRHDGSYTLLIPVAPVSARPLSARARLIGYRADSIEVRVSDALSAGASLVANFSLADNPLELGEIVVTGAGTATEVEKLGTVRSSVDGATIARANEQNLVNALAAKAPNVTVTSSSGDPGASAYIQIRGLTTIESSDGQPLFVIDGVPVDNSTTFSNSNLEGMNGSHLFPPNRLIDVNPDDIEKIEILKGAASAAIYGSRAGQGVILITTRKARAGETRYALRSSWSLQQHTQLPALQTEYGQGTGGVADECAVQRTTNCFVGISVSYGEKLAAGTPVYDHQAELFRDGFATDHALTASGGSERSQFFLSGGYSYNRGIVVGDNNHYRRISVRLNGSHRISDRLMLGANVAYSSGSGGFLESRNSTGGLLLAAWRTPPEFNNLPYRDAVFGLHRSYRFPSPGPGSEQFSRGYDNPFFVAYENPATSGASRTFGGITADWTPTSWLKIGETLGLDYSTDERFEGWSWSSSSFATTGVIGHGGVSAGYLRRRQVDHNLIATARYRMSSDWEGSVTLGQNINSQRYQSRQTLGVGLITPRPFKLGNTAELVSPAHDYLEAVNLESYFAQVTGDLWSQLYLTVAVRNDGVSTFGPESRRHWFPKGSAAWVFRGGARQSSAAVSYGKLRAAYGQSGTRPPPYVMASVLVPNGLGGLLTGPNRPTAGLAPERVKEFEAGIDLGLFGNTADLSLTHYRQNSTDVIMQVPVESSSGYTTTVANAASLQNRGWEISLNLRPITTRALAWDIEAQWARNRGITTALAEFVEQAPLPFDGGGGGCCVAGSAVVGEPIGVYRGLDYVRCGRGILLAELDLDASEGHCRNAPAGALYLGGDGRPVVDGDNQRVIGDPNPEWTGSVRSTLRIGRVSFSGLLDVRHGGVGYNGTRGALNEFGTGLNTAQGRNGAPVVFGRDYYPGPEPTPVAGPGVGVPVPLDESWFRGSGSVFSGIGTLFLEDGGWVKLREISIGYTLSQPWVMRRVGFESIEIRLAGRNLKSWNRYSGVDPETAILGAASAVRGIDYFNNPQTRAWVLTMVLTR